MKYNEYNMGQEPELSPVESEGQEEEEEKVNLSTYRDSEGLSVSKLDAGLWYVENKEKMKNRFFAFLMFLGVVFWLYFFLQYGSYLVKGISLERQITREILAQNLPPAQYYHQPGVASLELLPVMVLNGVGGKKDFIGQISNPNPNHWARFKYHFEVNGQSLSNKDGFVLPGQKKKLIDLGREVRGSSAGVKIVIEDIQWARVNPHDFGKWDQFYQDHMDFEVSDINFDDGDNSTLSDKIALNDLSFEIKNESDFNYWNVPLIISLYNYKDLISIGTYEVNDFEADETRSINFTWPGDFPNISEIEIEPDLDITRLDIYKEFKSNDSIFR